MSNQSGKTILMLVFLLLVAGTTIYYITHGFRQQELTNKTVSNGIPIDNKNTNNAKSTTKMYSSEDLNISLEYPNAWIVDDRYVEVLLANFQTSLNSNKKPQPNQIEILLHNARGCHKTIDENLKDPACGEGGSNIKPNEIVSRETEDLNGIKFHKYLIKYPDGTEHQFYFLEKGDRILQIDKKPDPSMFEKEFEEVIKSIKFIN